MPKPRPNKYAQMAEVAKQHMEPAPTPQQIELEEAIAEKVKATGKPRPMGKSRDPRYEKLTVYIRRTTRKAVDLRLVQEEPEQELSELVEKLLADWALSRLAV